MIMFKEVIFPIPKYLKANHVGCNGVDRFTMRAETFYILPENVTKNYTWTSSMGETFTRDRYIGLCPICGKNIEVDILEYEDYDERLLNICKYISENINKIAYISYIDIEKRGGFYYRSPNYLIIDPELQKDPTFRENNKGVYYNIRSGAGETIKIIDKIKAGLRDTVKVFEKKED